MKNFLSELKVCLKFLVWAMGITDLIDKADEELRKKEANKSKDK